MPKRKTTDASVESAVAPEKKRATAAKTTLAAAATHKRTSRTSTAATASEYVHAESEIARRAYSYWEARGYQGGSPADDWFRAERELREFSQNR